MPIQTYKTPEEAARASRERMAVSPPITQHTPRGDLPCILIKPLYKDGWYAYASAPGIRIPESYARAYAKDIDAVKEWKAY